ncbi:uncharacterized protein LOC135471770 isoform X2 [Liolophura sinensis]|uniref:uncharacterized protein LOC135471770 isoform X2 n=1 Tax=Liolophura sinensis TaxID=3198878 RepID=UPI0031582B52
MEQISCFMCVSLFRYCGANFLVDEHEGFTVELFGELFPVGLRICQVKFASTDRDDKLLYRVISSNVFKINEEISLDSSRDGKKFTSEEFITVTSPPNALNEEREGERFINVSAYRSSGYVDSTFSIIFQIYGEEYEPLEQNQSSYLGGSITLGVVLGIGCVVVIVIIIVLYVKKSKFGQNQRNQRQSAVQRAQQQDSQQHDGTPMTYLNDMPPLATPAFLPPYPTAPSGDMNVFTVHPHAGIGPITYNELPPSYDEVIKSGMSEVTL